MLKSAKICEMYKYMGKLQNFTTFRGKLPISPKAVQIDKSRKRFGRVVVMVDRRLRDNADSRFWSASFDGASTFAMSRDLTRRHDVIVT